MTERRQSILVVDDDAGARLAMRAALTKAGYEVRTAEGGEEALRQFRATPSDLVMLDVEMPDRGGHEVCAILRAEAGPLLPIVMVTGMDDIASVGAAYEHGATDFIAKPVNWVLLGHRVRYLFRSGQALLVSWPNRANCVSFRLGLAYAVTQTCLPFASFVQDGISHVRR